MAREYNMKIKKSIFILSLCYQVAYTDPLTGYGDHLSINYKNNQMQLMGKASLQTPSMTLHADSIFYDKTQIKLLAKNNVNLLLNQENIQMIADILNKNHDETQLKMFKNLVQTKQDDKTIESEKVIIFKEKNGYKVNFIGKPLLNNPKVTVSTDQSITYLTKLKTMKFNGLTKITNKSDQTTIQSHDVDYRSKEDILIFPTALNIIDKDNNYLSGNQGSYNSKTKDLDLKGKVNFIGKKASIFSDKLHSSHEKKEEKYFFTENPSMKMESIQGTAKNIIFNKTKDVISLEKDVHVLGTENDIDVTSHLMKIYQKLHQSFFYKNVVVKKEGKIIKGNLAVYNDLLDLFTVKGDVSMYDQGNVYYSDSIEINNKTNLVELIGNIRGESSLHSLKGLVINNE